MTNSILLAGEPSDYKAGLPMIYEQTSTTPEYVRGRVGCKGTAANQGKLYVANSVPLFAFDTQKFPSYVNNVVNNFYATSARSIDIIRPFEGPLPLSLEVKDGQSLALFDLLDPEGGSGLLIKHVAGGYACAIALAACAPSGANGECPVLFFGPLFAALRVGALMPARALTETVTTSAHTATLTNTPILVEYVERTTATTTGGCKIVVANNPIQGEVKVNFTTKVLTFNSTDNVTAASVKYWY